MFSLRYTLGCLTYLAQHATSDALCAAAMDGGSICPAASNAMGTEPILAPVPETSDSSGRQAGRGQGEGEGVPDGLAKGKAGNGNRTGLSTGAIVGVIVGAIGIVGMALAFVLAKKHKIGLFPSCVAPSVYEERRPEKRFEQL